MNYRLDLFAVFIFLGIVQAIFLCFFFFTGENRKVKANVFQGLMLLSIALCVVEVFLMYTGYIVDCLYLVDFSEPIVFFIGPFFYLMVISIIRGSVKKKHYWHLLFPFVYALALIPYFAAPEAVKYNSWIESYKPGLPYLEYTYDRGDLGMFWLTDQHTELVLVSLTLYATLSLVPIIKAFRQRRESFWRPVNPSLRKMRSGAIQVVTVTLGLVVIKLLNENDTGDHWLAAYITVVIYFTSFSVVRQSGFFRQAPLSEPKYKSSAASPELFQNILQKLNELMKREKPFLRAGFSLPELAQQLGTTVHVLSQVINEGLGKNFFEMTAEYRVEEAKRLLREQRNIKVEEIAEQVGYSSKSSFNTAFKKITGKTPSEFRGA